MILCDKDILERLNRGDIVIEPWDERMLQPASVDLRLGYEILRMKPGHGLIDTRNMGLEYDVVPCDNGFILNPGEFILASTLERIGLPVDIAARADGRSSIGRLGVTIHVTAGFIDPGFHGAITLEMSNIGSAPVKLYPEQRVCQLVFEELSGAAMKPYGSPCLGSKYYGQDGPTPSRIGMDRF